MQDRSISMKTLATSSFFVLFALVMTVAGTPDAFADHATALVSTPAGTSSPGCETTNECFIPASVTVDVGGEVTWSNDDTAAHTVTSGTAGDGPDGVFDSSLFMAGTTFSHTFAEAGTYSYFCMVHPWMIGTVTVEAEAMEEEHMEETAEGIMVDITTSEGMAGEMLTIDLTFTSTDGGAVEHVNYDVMATQGSEVVLDEKGAHDHDGVNSHTTAALPLDASDTMPVDVTVTFNGFGIPPAELTGPVGEVATKQVVPEFGTIAMIVLGVAIMSIIVVSAKSKVIPRM